MSKKNKLKKYDKVKSYSSDSDEMMRMLKVLGVVVLCLAAFYLVFAISTGEISFGKKDTKVNDEIQNIEILAGTTFSRIDSEYYVLMYDFSKGDSSIYSNIYDISGNVSSTKMYLVDLGKKFNSSYITDDKSKVNISDINNLKVVNGTMIKVQDGKGVSYSIGIDDIKKELTSN